MPIQQVTASRTNRSLVGQAPDRAADLGARRRAMADPVLLFYKRMLDSALAEAKKTKDGKPTDMAVLTLAWIKAAPVSTEDKGEYFRSLAGVCEQLGLEVKVERRRMLDEIKRAYAEAAAKQIQVYVNGRLASVLTCAGRPALQGRQYVLGLVSVEEYDEIAGIERPDPPERAPRTRAPRRR